MKSLFLRFSGWIFDVLGTTKPTPHKELTSYGAFWLLLLGIVVVLIALGFGLLQVVGNLGH